MTRRDKLVLAIAAVAAAFVCASVLWMSQTGRTHSDAALAKASEALQAQQAAIAGLNEVAIVSTCRATASAALQTAAKNELEGVSIVIERVALMFVADTPDNRQGTVDAVSHLADLRKTLDDAALRYDKVAADASKC